MLLIIYLLLAANQRDKFLVLCRCYAVSSKESIQFIQGVLIIVSTTIDDAFH